MSKKSLESHSKKTLENAIKRLKIESAEILLSPIPEIETRPRTADNFFEWVAKINGPVDSPYEDGIFDFHMSFPSNYPFKPPSCKFDTRIYHCNVNSLGMVCLDILGDSWIPSITITSILMCIRTLMTDPNPYHPLVGSIGAIYISDRKLHDDTARDWTKKYALKPK